MAWYTYVPRIFYTFIALTLLSLKTLAGYIDWPFITKSKHIDEPYMYHQNNASGTHLYREKKVFFRQIF